MEERRGESPHLCAWSSLALVRAVEEPCALLGLPPPAALPSLPVHPLRALQGSESLVVNAGGSVIVVWNCSLWWGRSPALGCVLLLRQCKECPQSRAGHRSLLPASDNLGRKRFLLFFSSLLILHHLVLRIRLHRGKQLPGEVGDTLEEENWHLVTSFGVFWDLLG